MALVDKIDLGAGWVSSALRTSNTSGTPLTSAAENASGELIADEYTLAFSAVGGGTATVTVGSSSPNNPYHGRVVTGVPCDGATAVSNIIPGLDMVFSAGVANGNAAHVDAGVYLGVFDASGVDAGEPSDGIRHQVTNTGTGAVADAKVTLMTQSVQVKKVGNTFKYIKPYAPGATSKVVGGGSTRVMPYALKIVNTAGSGPSKTCDLQVDGATLGAASLAPTTTGIPEDGTGIKAIDTFAYRILTGPLTGLEFAIAAACANNDIANVLIFPSAFVQTAIDTAGSEGTYGPADVALTQVGESAGVIQPSQVAYYWMRILVPIGGGAESNPYPANAVLQASETGSAGWTV